MHIEMIITQGFLGKLTYSYYKSWTDVRQIKRKNCSVLGSIYFVAIVTLTEHLYPVMKDFYPDGSGLVLVVVLVRKRITF